MSSLFPQTNLRFIDVILPLSMPQALTYGVPADFDELLLPGMRVEVTLGANRQYAGIIVRIHNNAPESYEVKPLRGVIDDAPVVNEKQLAFWEWIANYYAAAPGEVMQAALPAHLKLQGETRVQWAPLEGHLQTEWTEETARAVELLKIRKAITLTDLRTLVGRKNMMPVLHELLEAETIIINDSLEPLYKRKTEKIVSLGDALQRDGELQKVFAELGRAPKQMETLMTFLALSKSGEVRQTALLEAAGTSPAALKALAEKGTLIIEERDTDRVHYKGSESNAEITFTSAQAQAFAELEEGLQAKDVALLQGVTGSGKTLLYIQKIREALADGRQALFLLPEIGLTTQLVRRLYAYFGDELGVYHSRFSNNERVEIWEKVLNGKYKVVIGPRSAVWLPFSDLGVIIADEEHDPSYKQQDPSPRFHARDAAIYLAHLHGAKVILGSATPSVESLYNVQQKKYAYAGLKERYRGVKMPAIEIINAKSLDVVKKDGFSILTPELQEAMKEALAADKQIILFQNRRGYSPFQICTVCGLVPQCPNCSVSLTYHKANDKLQCHYCGRSEAPLVNCTQCGSNRISSRSFGTEKIEEEVKKAFPNARTARMDVDSMRGRHALSNLLDEMERREVDILVGTQMVVKGLDFAPVALVAILNADGLLSFPDFRVNERGFQLMEQVSGRAGRADGEGRVLIQAYNLQHPVLDWVTHHDVGAFYKHEVGYREFFGYPPFVRMIKVIFKHKEEPKALMGAGLMAEALQKFDGNIQVQGPVPGIIARIRNLYVQEVWIKCPRDARMLEALKAFIKLQRLEINGTRGLREVQVGIDVDPV